MHLQLRLLREPRRKRGAPCAIQATRIGRLNCGLLPPQLHRRAFPQFRRYQKPRLHHGTDDRSTFHPAKRIQVPWIHPRQSCTWHLARAYRGTGAFGRPPKREHGTSIPQKLGAFGARQVEAEHRYTHAANKRVHRRRPRHPRPYAQEHHLLRASAHRAQNPRFRACRAIDADDNRCRPNRISRY